MATNAPLFRTVVAAATIGAMFNTWSGSSAHAGAPNDVWGLKSQAAVSLPSMPPTRLFRFPIAGGPLVDLGAVTFNGAQTDVDGLAVLPSGKLIAFLRQSSAVQMIEIAPIGATATAIGSPLAGRDLRGAVATDEDEVLAVDAAQEQLLRINTVTGEIVGDPLPLTLGCLPFNLLDSSDIAMRSDGLLVIVSGNQYMAVSPTTGRMQLLHTDVAPITGGGSVSFAGTAFAGGDNESTLFAYEVNGADDIVSYDTANDFVRTIVYTNILPAFNAGRGDLGSWIDASPLEPDLGPLADLDGNGVVDGADLGILLSNWGPCRGCCIDLNGDGVIDGADLGLLLTGWSAP